MKSEKKNPLEEGLRIRKIADKNTLVIFGATGDLTKRKLMPALFSLFKQGFIPKEFDIIAFARSENSDDSFRKAVEKTIASEETSSDSIEHFLERISYFRGAYSEADDFKRLKSRLEEIDNNVLYYLATPPSAFDNIIHNLGAVDMTFLQDHWTRVIIEKPFGHDLDSARMLNGSIQKVFNEDQVYRIDHYLGKETVQNLLVFRFANTIFEPIWNRRYIDHIQITVSEKIGIEGRGGFFEETGILRDIVQNHMMQLMCLVAMEPPSTTEPNAIRDEKVKVLHAVRSLGPDIDENVKRGQYTEGSIDGNNVKGYRDEENVSPQSKTETYVALRLMIENWRWAGVPFYLRCGKRLPKKVTEIAIYFKKPPLLMFGHNVEKEAVANVLTVTIQPDEGISLSFDSKIPGYRTRIRPVTMEFRYGTSFGQVPPDAYERLLLDAMIGDPTLFTRADENEQAWKIIDPILSQWQEDSDIPVHSYSAGSWGPKKVDNWIEKQGRLWRRL